MKHLAIALIFLPLFTIAQEQKKSVRPQMEFSISYGRLTNAQLSEAINLRDFTYKGYLYEGNHFFGAVTAAASRYSANKRFRVGVTLGYDAIKGRYHGLSDPIANQGEYRSRHITAATEGSVAYIKKKNFRFYGLAGLGFTRASFTRYPPGEHKISETTSKFNLQVSPIGLSFGEQAGIFVELGLGYKGLINVGMFARF